MSAGRLDVWPLVGTLLARAMADACVDDMQLDFQPRTPIKIPTTLLCRRIRLQQGIQQSVAAATAVKEEQAALLALVQQGEGQPNSRSMQ